MDSYPRFTHDIAITFYSELRNPAELVALRRFIKDRARRNAIVFVANETRRNIGAEYDIYQAMFPRWSRVFGAPADFFAPNYRAESTAELVSHFGGYDVVVSSRYHSLLIAAWAGARIVAINRSSKIRALALELGVPMIESPFQYEDLCEGLERAVAVDRQKLMGMANSARHSMYDFLERLARS